MKRTAFLLAFFLAVAFVSNAESQTQSQQQQQPTATSVLQSPFGGTTGQTQGMGTGTTSMFTTSAELYRNLQSQGVTIQPPAYDAPVDTSKYVLGPGDMVNVGVWGATPLSYTLSVTPEGSLVIPAYGVLRVGGMTIAAAKDYARTELSKQFRNSKITLTLVYPRTFYVTVAGEVKTPARYIVDGFDRVDRVFTLANLPKFAGDNSPLPPFSLRRIRLIHSNGTSQRVDLLKFYQSGDVSDDPYLQPGDAVVVPRENFALGTISISGAVKMPGTYEHVRGDRMKDLLEICQGMTQVADSTAARLYEWNGHNYSERTVNLEDSSSLDIPLPANSRVVIPMERSKVNNYYVTITGEVHDPGIYPISPDTTTLNDIIKTAGGFTRWASLEGAVIFRTRQPDVFTPPHPANPSDFTNRASDVTQEELNYASQELGMRTGKEVVSTDFVKLFADKDMKYNVTLRAGDSIYVPQSQRAVYVMGQVKYPGYVDYKGGWTYTDYIAMAGGLTEGAERDGIRILKHGTYQWYKPGDTHIEAGDIVFVPRVSIKPELYSWNLFKDIIGTIGSVASIALTAILVIRTAQGK